MVGQRTLNPFILVRVQARQLVWTEHVRGFHLRRSGALLRGFERTWDEFGRLFDLFNGEKQIVGFNYEFFVL